MKFVEYLEEYEKIGVPPEHAKVHLKILENIINSNLATKQNIEELRKETKQDIALIQRDIEELRKDTKRDIKELDLKIESVKRDIKELEVNLKKDTTIKVYRGIGLLLAAIFALAKLKLLSVN